MTKIIVAVVVIIVIIAAIAGALLLTGGKTTEKPAPTAVLTASASVVDESTAVTFDASGSHAAVTGGTITNYMWNFGDGTTTNTTTPTVSHTYTGKAGLFEVVVTVTDNNGTTGTSWAAPAAVQVLVPETPAETTNATAPTPVVAVDNQVIKTGAVVKLNANSSIAYSWNNSAGDVALISTLTWNFGDGTAAATGNLSKAGFQAHTYTGDGKVFVTKLTVVSTHGASADYFVTIIVVPAATTSAGGVKNPDTFTMATIGEPQTLDPAWDYETAGGEILQNCYETLVFYDGGSLVNLKPLLCTQIPTEANGGISADGKNYTFTIRQNVQFHDGQTMTIDDVAYSFKRTLIMNDVEGAAWMLGQFLLGAQYPGLGDPSNISAAAVDAAITTNATTNTITFHLVSPCPAWLYILAFQCGSVVEKAWVEAHAPGTTTTSRWVGATFNTTKNKWEGGHAETLQVPQQYLKGGGNGYIDRNVMGTGPYKLKTWAPSQYIIMQKWDGYWGVKPALKFVVIQKVQDVGTREMLLLSGQADSIYVPRQNMADVRNKAGVDIVEGLPTLEVDFFGMNEKIVSHLDIGNIPTTFFTDVHIRQAFVHAFDYNKYLTDVMQGTAVQPNGPIPLGMLGYDSLTPNTTFDLSISAAQLNLAQNPLVPGSTYADTGFHVVLYYNAGNLPRQAGCQLLKDGLEKLSQNASAGVAGTITVDIQALDWPTYLDARANKWLPMFFLGWLVDYPDPDDFAAPFCDQNGAFPVTLSITNQTLTDLVHQAATELNSTLRIQLYHQITQRDRKSVV